MAPSSQVGAAGWRALIDTLRQEVQGLREARHTGAQAMQGVALTLAKIEADVQAVRVSVTGLQAEVGSFRSELNGTPERPGLKTRLNLLERSEALGSRVLYMLIGALVSAAVSHAFVAHASGSPAQGQARVAQP